MSLLQIISLISPPLFIASIIGIICLWNKNKIEFFLLLLMLGGSVFWRLKITATSDRYAFALILPAIFLSGYAGQSLCTKINKTAFCERTTVYFLVICFFLLISGTCCMKALRVHSMQDFYIKVGQGIAMDSKKNTSSITLDFSKGNALRFYNYSKCKTIQEESSHLLYSDFNQVLNQKTDNYSQIYDSVYITAITAHNQETIFDKNKSLIPMIRMNTNSKKNKQVHLYRYVSSPPKKDLQDDQIIWAEDMTNPINQPEVLSYKDKKIIVPSKKIMKDWTINLSDGAEPDSFGKIELKQIGKNINALHMSSENIVTIYYNPLYPLNKKQELCILYKGLSESVFSVKAYFYNENKSLCIGTKTLENVSVNKMKDVAVFRCLINPSMNSDAFFFRIALSLQRGNILVYNVKLYSLLGADSAPTN